MNIIDAILLFSAMTALALLPSTSVALVVTRSATAGFANGAAVAAGIVLGDLIFVCLAVLGMAVIAEVMGVFFVAIKWLAGLYLIWFGLSLLRADTSYPETSAEQCVPSLSVSFSSGLLVTLGDIKAIFFYASFFPAFIDLAHLSRWDVLVIAMLTVISVGGVKLGYAYGAEKMVGLAGRHRRVRGVKVAAGGLMMGAGAWLIAGTAGQS
jgi:Putative threonine efflux protein